MRWAPALLFLCFFQPVQAQETDSSEVPDATQSAQLFTETEIEDPQFTLRPGEADLLKHIEYLHDHPLDLNSASLEELQSVPGMTSNTAETVIEYRRKIKVYLSVVQLASIPGSGGRIYHQLFPFVTVSRGSRRSHAELRTRLIVTHDDATARNQSALYERILAGISKNTSIGLLMEKPQGATLANGFLSGYFEIQGLPWISQMVIGDFVMSGGQGLVFWRNRYSSKGLTSDGALRRCASDIQPSCSSSDATLRGIGISLAHPAGLPATLSLAISKRDLRTSSASLDESEGALLQELNASSAAITTGGRLVERLVGGRLVWSPIEEIIAACSYSRAWFDRPAFEPTAPGDVRSGSDVVGIDLHSSIGTAQFFGEAARSTGKATAIALGWSADLPGSGSVAGTWHDYSPRFFNAHAGGFGENDLTRNETGFFTSCNLPFGRRMTFSGYLDQFRFPTGSGDDKLPRGGSEVAFQLQSRITGQTSLAIRVARNAQSESIAPADARTRLSGSVGERRSNRESLSVRVTATPHILLSTRITAIQTVRPGSGGGGAGQLLAQEFAWHPGPTLQCTARIVVVGTGVQAPPVYLTEGDLPGAFSHTMFSGGGTRWLLMVQWRPAPWIRTSVKWSVTEKEQIPSGASPGSAKMMDTKGIGLQIDCWF